MDAGVTGDTQLEFLLPLWESWPGWSEIAALRSLWEHGSV